MAESIEIPEGGDKILFAEDLVNCVMHRLVNVDYPYPSAEPFRNLVYNGFNKTARYAVYFIQKAMEIDNEEIFSHMRKENSVNTAAYENFANEVRRIYLSNEFDIRNFFQYCVYLASLATNFYMDGVQEAPGLAVSYIVSAFDGIDMAAGGWVALNLIAKELESKRQNSVLELSPETSDDEGADRIVYEQPDQNYIAETDDDSSSSSEKSSEESEGNKVKKCKCKTISGRLKGIYSEIPPIEFEDKILNEHFCVLDQFGPGPSNEESPHLCSYCVKKARRKVKKNSKT